MYKITINYLLAPYFYAIIFVYTQIQNYNTMFWTNVCQIKVLTTTKWSKEVKEGKVLKS